MSSQRSHLSLRPAGSTDATLSSLPRAGRGGRRRRLWPRSGVPRESELDVGWLAGGKRNQAAESQLWFLTKGRNCKRKISSEQRTHHQQLRKMWAFSLLVQMQRGRAGRILPLSVGFTY